jgi:hypothetical protein
MKSPGMTASELLAELNADPEYRKMRAEKERAFAKRAAELTVEQQPLIEDLRKIGIFAVSIWDFVNSPNTYAHAIPMLLDHLNVPIRIP